MSRSAVRSLRRSFPKSSSRKSCGRSSWRICPPPSRATRPPSPRSGSSPERGLEEKLTKLYARQVAGFDHPEVKKFYIVPERTTEAAATAPALGLSAGTVLEKALLAHELTHALQDRRLDLVRRMKALKDSSDGPLALEASLEGEATVVMMDALLVEVPPESKELFGADTLSKMLAGLAAGTTNVEGSDGVPDFFVKESAVPQRLGHGVGRGEALRRSRMVSVDPNYASPPTTTAEILHPERTRYASFSRPVDIPSAAELPAGMRVLYMDTSGVDVADAPRAAGAPDPRALAAAWQDDRILFFEPKRVEGEARPVGFLWRIRTTSPEAARRLAAALAPLYERRTGFPWRPSRPFRTASRSSGVGRRRRSPSASLQELQRCRQEDEELHGVERPVGGHRRNDLPSARTRSRTRT